MDHRESGREHLIVAFVDDLMSATRIESVASQLGFLVRSVGRAGTIMSEPAAALPERPGEPVDGPYGALMEVLTGWHPSLLIFDMANLAIPWREWLMVLKSSPATRRIPVICYGPHVDELSMREAADLTTERDAVVPRSKFFATMPQMIADLARHDDYPALIDGCNQPLPPSALQGLEAFNAGHYFEAHEYLEDAWNDEQGPVRDLYRAILQVAVAYLQIERRNYRGALKMFLRTRQWLTPLPDNCRGVDVARLRVDADRARQAVVELGPDGLDRFDLASLPPVSYVDLNQALLPPGDGQGPG